MFDFLTVMLDFLPSDKSIIQSLDSFMTYLSQNKAPLITEWSHIFFPPRSDLNIHRLFYYNYEKDAFICFLVSQKATFLPDWISKPLQLYGGYNLAENAVEFYWIREVLFRFISLFTKLCIWRVGLTFWLIFNPYDFPWYILGVATDWYTEIYSGMLPLFLGIDFSGIVGLAGLAAITNYLENLVLTMPYLPSEGVKEMVGKYPVYRFSDFPRLWSEYGIPNELREQWYEQQPEIIEHFLKYYGDIEQDIVPDRIIEGYYNEYIKHATITTSLTNSDHLLTASFSSVTNILDTNIMTNQISIVYEKLIHNF